MSSELEDQLVASRTLHAGSDAHYRAYVGPPGQFDFMGATQFRLLTGLGLREEHRLLDLGCGALRAGRLMLQYLLPERYVGVEPNDWLWRGAVEAEIGPDVLRLKRPLLLNGPDVVAAEVGAPVDFAIAQSIYSHTGMDLFRNSVAQIRQVLAPGGQFLFTIIEQGSPNSHKMENGTDVGGWIYPYCVTFDPQTAVGVCAEVGLTAQRLSWFHPRQTWYRATLDGSTLDAGQIASLGDGKPLFDTRFR